jgi:hypothetical protein
MPFKPNYRFERTERERKKQAKKEEKLKRRQEKSASGDPAARSDIGDETPPSES